jgi:shikimate kinase
MVRGYGKSYGAISIITAFASGKGCALGIDLPVEVAVEFKRGLFEENTFLDQCIAEVFAHLSVEMDYIPHLSINSAIPASRGLKSSSAVANAVICATLDALDESLPPEEILQINAAASLWGGVVFTDNWHNRILKREQFSEKVQAVLYVPEEIRSSLDVHPLMDQINLYSSIVDSIFSMAYNGHIYEAMTLNGLVYASLFGYASNKITDAITAGAKGASLSGKGSAVAALVPNPRVDDVVEAWGKDDVRVVEVRGGQVGD